MSNDIEHSVDGDISTIWLNRPEKRNAMGLAMLEQLADLFAAPLPQTARAVVLRARGPVFCSGLDLTQRDGTRNSANRFEALLKSMDDCPVPIVGVVQGDCFGGGTELALHCDLVVASTSARFGMPLVQLGLCPSWDLIQALTETMGPALTRKMLMLGNPLPAATLLAAGAIAEAVPPDQLEETAGKVVARLAANAPISLRIIKKTVARLSTHAGRGAPHDDIEADLVKLRQSEDAKEGMKSRVERRPPVFKGV